MTEQCRSTAGPWVGGTINTAPCRCNRPDGHEPGRWGHTCGCGAFWSDDEGVPA